mmetsp:Transcript_112919/g.243256  ORF Transcript_112919/g.243256 Transcript_112919/m.243256 type:complete len:105 (-) Transcript_112919:123-437(-)
MSESVATGTLIRARPIGVMDMMDENEKDDKVIMVFVSDPVFGGCTKLSDIHPSTLREITYFFETYKMGKNVVVGKDIHDEVHARKRIEDTYQRFLEHKDSLIER